MSPSRSENRSSKVLALRGTFIEAFASLDGEENQYKHLDKLVHMFYIKNGENLLTEHFQTIFSTIRGYNLIAGIALIDIEQCERRIRCSP